MMTVPSPISFAVLLSPYERAPLGIAIYDADFRYIDVNDTFAAFNCLDRAAHRGRLQPARGKVCGATFLVTLALEGATPRSPAASARPD